MNELQKCEFDILKIFLDICQKEGYSYYLACGTALGAVKYGGFIPWDDDIDVVMPRGDYDRFCKQAQALLPEHIFLQNYMTDPEFPHPFSKLRNSETAYIEKNAAGFNINHGVFIDIFPIDGHPAAKPQQMMFELKRKLLQWKQFCAFNGNSNLKVRVRNKLFRILGYHKKTQKTLDKLSLLYRSYPLESSALWCNYGNYQGKLEYAPREQYGEGAVLEFEGMPIRVPEKYDEYLTQKFGDWRSDPKKEDQVGHHYYTVCDLHRSYVHYTDKS